MSDSIVRTPWKDYMGEVPMHLEYFDGSMFEAVENVAATRTGFTAETDYDTDRLVFFSVPYDDGFTATVNGEPATIEKVDDGLMAVCVPAGENEIEFTYHTPGLKVSATVSAVAIVVYGVYLGILRKKKRGNKPYAKPC